MVGRERKTVVTSQLEIRQKPLVLSTHGVKRLMSGIVHVITHAHAHVNTHGYMLVVACYVYM